MSKSIKLDHIFNELPEYPKFINGIRRAPKREMILNDFEIKLALKNALRYIPKKWHDVCAPEFLEELLTRGRIYGYRFRPIGQIKGLPIDHYKANTLEGKAFQVMIDNNLDFDVALYPYELVTYGETGQVCQNWMQYQLIKKYLEIMEDDQTLSILSGHPLGLFKSTKQAPRVVLTNGLMVGSYDNMHDFNRAQALGVANYGQMTAGGFMYIGPQGIVHGTYSTLLNAGRLKLNIPDDQNLKGKLFVSSGLGGMSGAQGKAIEIAGGVGIIAEVDLSRIETRINQKWVSLMTSSEKEAFNTAQDYLNQGKPIAIAYHGNIVDLLEYAEKNNIHIDLLSDQTSCHAVYDGGYCPVGLSFEERTNLLNEDKSLFIKKVNNSLKKHYEVIKRLVNKGTYFFDYGNSFLKAIYDSGVKEICKNKENDLDGFIYPSYVEDLMGPLLFDYGYGPFRWVCLSHKDADLDLTDQVAMSCINPNRRFQDKDNYEWIKNAKHNQLVVGTKARILYQDAEGRLKIALAFNKLVRDKKTGPIMLGRDHHDTGGTDSPFRETANIKDGSNIMADMATHVALGNALRGMSLVSLHNGGGVGIGKAINGGYGMVLDGSTRVDDILKQAMIYDVMAGVSRRSWATNINAIKTVESFNSEHDEVSILTPEIADEDFLTDILKKGDKLMKQKIVQCVPNFSEGKDQTLIEKIVEPLKNRKGFKLVSYESDKDYNRTVVTLIGDPEQMLDPLMSFFDLAKKLIDMNHQTGEHPRMGAVDVVPFIPIENISIEECIDISKKLGSLVYEKLGIPVFLYAKSATLDERIELPNIRRGEFEGMKEKLSKPEWKPDFGKNEIHPTFGVVAIGARIPLIAYNIDLDTDDMKIHKNLSKAIRQSSGGFQYIQAGPAFIEDKHHTQVTMNILDYKKNPIYRVYETIHMEALRYGIKVISSEIVGLVPRDAIYRSLRYYLDMENITYDKDMSFDDIVSYAIKYLGLRDFDKSKIIEAHIEGSL